MSRIKGIIFLGLFIIALIGSVSISRALQDSGCYEYCVFTLDFRMSQWMINSLLNVQGVSQIYWINEETQTRIVLDEGLVDGIGLFQVRNYLGLIERNELNNKARTTIYPDGQIPPLCLKDAINGNINGVYSANNQLFVLANDSRCQ